MTRIPQLSIKYPVTVLMIFIGIVLLGLISVFKLPLNLFPDVRYPRITIVTESQGMAPEEVERRLSEPLENMMAGVRNVEQVTSISRAGQSLVMVDFVWGSDMDFALLDVKKAAGDLREDNVSMNFLRFDPNAMPILTLGLTGGDDLVQMKHAAEKTLKPFLEKVPGVAQAEAAGGLTGEVSVELDAGLLAAYGFSYDQVMNGLRQSNIEATGGWIEDANRRYIVRAVAEFKTLDDIREVVAGYKGNTPIYVSDVGEVEWVAAVEDSLVRINGEAGVGISLYKEPDANTVATVNTVRDTLEELKKYLPEEFKLTEVFDQSRFITEAIGEVRRSAIYGIILAVIVLLYFLKNLRTTLIIALAIPVSIIATFNLMYFGNLSLNIMTLGGLALGAGMLVDNAIVVLENIFRLRQQGASREESAAEGCSEVSAAIVSSTLTTCVVFLPIVYLRGVTGLLFRQQALTVVFALLTSLFVALSFIPMLCARFLKVTPNIKKRRSRWHPLRWLSLFFYSERVKELYLPMLRWSLRHRWIILLITAGMVWASLQLLPRIPQELIPKSDQPQLVVDLSLPVGSSLAVTDQAVDRLEGKLREFGDGISSFYSEIGIPEESKRKAEEEAKGPHTAKILIRINTEQTPRLSSMEVIRRLEEEVEDIWELEVRYQLYANSVESFFGSGQAPLMIEIKGPRLEKLKEITRDIEGQLSRLPGLVNLRSNLLSGSPQVSIEPDRVVLAELGLDVRSLAQQIRSQLRGQLATAMKTPDGESDVILEMESEGTRNIDALRDLRLRVDENTWVNLDDVATVSIVPGPLEILRRDSERRAMVMAELEGVKLSAAVESVRDRLKNFYLPRGYSMRITGEEERRQASFENLRFALILALVLVYMVMASLFESLVHPLIVMFSAPLAAAGVILALLLTGTTLNLMAYIGVVMLAGIVVNNAIVLIDCVNRLRAEGQPVTQAILGAGAYRLRPILMTTATTVFALLPLAMGLGEGSELRAPMATAVIGGLISSTLLTLIFIPVVYSGLDSIRAFIIRMAWRMLPSTASEDSENPSAES
jgi:HAE1 family hydrophobic/amphiphilic exporter-1